MRLILHAYQNEKKEYFLKINDKELKSLNIDLGLPRFRKKKALRKNKKM